ncbi:hypothetical protein CF327_g581 [Tilletia walkeri]|uniref:Uncharacterized protein n=1 Tax=Tilletia walkeri TaxID=117179 RepID=A0A8X7N5B4_9BASI|nr:hypothetical protein CF327_g581 [Tilletia walkeri]KAE8266075.1 hypothetical protein A4X09_0g6271 [Tilletia walkeri]
MPPRLNFADLAQRGVVVGLVGTGIWGLWLTAAVYKSRRGDPRIEGILTPTPERIPEGAIRGTAEQDKGYARDFSDKVAASSPPSAR